MRNVNDHFLISPRLWWYCLVVALIAIGGELLANEVKNVEFGEITNFSGNVDIIHTFASGEDRVQIGTKVYADDVIKTGKDGFIELMFGLNARLRLEADGEIILQDVFNKEKIEDEVEIIEKQFGVLLRYGILRVRVRENTVTPTPIILRAGEVRFFLPRSDFMIQRAPGDPQPQKMLNCVLGWGRVELQLQTLKSKSTDAAENAILQGELSVINKDSNPGVVNNTPGRLMISEMPTDNNIPQWLPLSNEEARKILREKAPFSVDQERNLPKEAPSENAELKGA